MLLLPLLLGCCTLFIPFVGVRALLSFDGESERSHVPWRATASFNWDAEPQLQCVCVAYKPSMCVYVYMYMCERVCICECLNCNVVYVFDDRRKVRS